MFHPIIPSCILALMMVETFPLKQVGYLFTLWTADLNQYV